MDPSPTSHIMRMPYSSNQGNGKKGVRMRSACDSCCGAKVRCTGERTGCLRCRTTNTQCVYQESRVGKVPGVRARNRRQESTQSDRPVQTVPTCMPQSTSTSIASTSDDGHSESPLWGEDTTIDVPETSAPFLHNHNSLVGTLNNSFALPDLDFDLEQLMEPIPPTPVRTASRQPQDSLSETSDSTQQNSRNRGDSQFVVNCAQVMSDLENYIVAELNSYSIAWDVTKRAVEMLVQLSEAPSPARSMRCTILLTAIMYQILDLFENCYVMLSKDSGTQNNPTFSLRPTQSLFLPGVGRGKMGLDAEEQSSWRCQMLLKEVHQTSDVLQRMKVAAAKWPEQTRFNHGITKVGCFVDIELRLGDLANRIARRR